MAYVPVEATEKETINALEEDTRAQTKVGKVHLGSSFKEMRTVAYFLWQHCPGQLPDRMRTRTGPGRGIYMSWKEGISEKCGLRSVLC